MSGIAALALCAAFTSCSNKEDLYDEGQINQNAVDKVKANYEAAFIATFGQPAANQDWGFGSLPSGTRNHGVDGCINVNGNMWEYAPAVDVLSNPTEVECIYDYVKDGIEQMQREEKPYSTKHPENLYGYFVTQIRNGKNPDNNYVNTYNNNEAVNGVGGMMNNLKIAMKEGLTMADLNDNNPNWEHINNFNAGDNYNHANANSTDHGNTKVEKKGAFDFAYLNSKDGEYHNKWILVDGADIEPTGKYSNYYYVCFDFECKPTDNQTFYTYIDTKGQSQNGDLMGTYFTNDEVAKALAAQGITDRKDINIYRWLHQDKMLKGDNKYTDWIIRITKGEPEYDIRIIAEDLNATASDDDVNSDWDFNDVVFDVKFLDPEDIVDGKNVKIRVVAAGGTYPLYVAGQEVHALFGQNTDVMINTNARNVGKYYDTDEEKVFYIQDDNAKSTNGKSIKVTVDMGNGPIEMEAVTGKPAAKIGVSPNFQYCMERKNIKLQYPLFMQWVQSSNPALWWNSSITFNN